MLLVRVVLPFIGIVIQLWVLHLVEVGWLISELNRMSECPLENDLGDITDYDGNYYEVPIKTNFIFFVKAGLAYGAVYFTFVFVWVETKNAWFNCLGWITDRSLIHLEAFVNLVRRPARVKASMHSPLSFRLNL